jgi:hypothetical protein
MQDDGDAAPRARAEGTGPTYKPFAGSYEGAPQGEGRDLMPQLWRRLREQKQGGVPAEQLPASGANITLEDIAVWCVRSGVIWSASSDQNGSARRSPSRAGDNWVAQE